MSTTKDLEEYRNQVQEEQVKITHQLEKTKKKFLYSKKKYQKPKQKKVIQQKESLNQL